MRRNVILCLVAGSLAAGCSKSKSTKNNDGFYSGISLTLAPLAPPEDSTLNKITLTLSDGKYSGTNDSVSSAFTMRIGQGTYAAESGKIMFTPDPGIIYSGPAQIILSGTFNVVKNGDSLVFQRTPDTGTLGGSTTIFRLKKN